SRLAKYVVTALSLREVPTYYWTDATVALCWIQREENWGVFVNNRVREIRSLSKKEYWRHIPGKLNPADIASRGCTLQHLLQYGWWEGPEFLKAFPESWPKSEFSPNEELIAAEMKKKIIVDLSVKIEKPEWFERLSSFSKIVRVFCWMMRFVNKLRKKPSYGTKTLTVEEKAKAEIILWSIEQKKHFHEKENSVHGLQVVRGDDEVLRVKTRIIERDDDLSFLYPILLPSKHYLTECLIREYHLKYCHAGVQILAAKLRLQYWIFSSKRNIRSCVSRCVVCKRFTAKALTTPPIQLPLDRVSVEIDISKFGSNDCLDAIATEFDWGVTTVPLDFSKFQLFVGDDGLLEQIRFAFLELHHQLLLCRKCDMEDLFKNIGLSFPDIHKFLSAETHSDMISALPVTSGTPTLDDASIASYVAKLILMRGALLTSICLATVMQRLTRNRISILVNSLFIQEYPEYQTYVKTYMAALAPEKSVKFLFCNNTSCAMGAALTAGVAFHHNKRNSDHYLTELKGRIQENNKLFSVHSFMKLLENPDTYNEGK
ncbi:reverse transcriptase, partial [Caerostris darwini]